MLAIVKTLMAYIIVIVIKKKYVSLVRTVRVYHISEQQIQCQKNNVIVLVQMNIILAHKDIVNSSVLDKIIVMKVFMNMVQQQVINIRIIIQHNAYNNVQQVVFTLYKMKNIFV